LKIYFLNLKSNIFAAPLNESVCVCAAEKKGTQQPITKQLRTTKANIKFLIQQSQVFASFLLLLKK
jgi:hypothetical protein